MKDIKRLLELSRNPKESFFLWGSRQTGKSSLLKKSYPNTVYIDLLKTSDYLKYLEKPWLLREELKEYISLKEKKILNSPIIIDEIQRVPVLLDEVHWLIENLGLKFALCGSSARKIRRGHANLLGGRAIRHELFGLSAAELKKEFDLNKMLNAGCLPRHYLNTNSFKLIDAYVKDYLKEEISNEALVRSIPSFSNFLNMASLSDTELVNYTNIARECGVSSNTVKEYFQILVDTLLGRFLPAFTKRPKRRVIQSPKFYFADVGVVNYLAKRGKLEPQSELYGKAFETWVFHELNVYNSYNDKFWDFSYWRLPSGMEVDFIVNDMEYATEAKSSSKVHDSHLKGLRELVKDQPKVKNRIVVSLVGTDRLTNDGIRILGAESFIRKLWNNNL